MHAKRILLSLYVKLSYKAGVAALHDVRNSLPDEDFLAQLDRLKALQLRIQAVSDRLEVIEARPTRHIIIMGAVIICVTSMLAHIVAHNMRQYTVSGTPKPKR